jgi:hypothetical protein
MAGSWEGMQMGMLKADEANLLEELMGVGDDGSPLPGGAEEPRNALLRAGLISQDSRGNFHITESGRSALLGQD